MPDLGKESSAAGQEHHWPGLTFVPKSGYDDDMEEQKLDGQDESVNLAAALGAAVDVALQCFTVYIPNKDREDQEFGTQRRWVLEAIRLLSEINGGATAIPVEGGWLNAQGKIILEHPVVIYSFVTDPAKFLESLPRLRAFLHRMGRETNQGEVAFEFTIGFTASSNLTRRRAGGIPCRNALR
jgi:hypothetical protein